MTFLPSRRAAVLAVVFISPQPSAVVRELSTHVAWGVGPMTFPAAKKNHLPFVRNCPITAYMQDTSPPFVLTVTEAAKAVRCRRIVLEEFIRTGELTAFSVGGQRGTRISQRALEAFMQKRALRN